VSGWSRNRRDRRSIATASDHAVPLKPDEELHVHWAGRNALCVVTGPDSSVRRVVAVDAREGTWYEADSSKLESHIKRPRGRPRKDRR
jgi:hypothetical protein